MFIKKFNFSNKINKLSRMDYFFPPLTVNHFNNYKKYYEKIVHIILSVDLFILSFWMLLKSKYPNLSLVIK